MSAALENVVIEENTIGENAFSDKENRQEFLARFMGDLDKAEAVALPYLRMAFSYLCENHGYNTVPLIEFGVAVRRHDPLWKGFSALMWYAGYNVRGKKDGSVTIQRDKEREVESLNMDCCMLNASGESVLNLREVKKPSKEKEDKDDREKAYAAVMALFACKKDGSFRIPLNSLSDRVLEALTNVQNVLNIEMNLEDAKQVYISSRDIMDHDTAMRVVIRDYGQEVADMLEDAL